MLKKTGTQLHESAADHARTLAPVLEKYAVDGEAMKSFLPPNPIPPASRVLHQNVAATKVIQMNLDEHLMAGLKRELVLRSKIDAAISNVAAGTYFPLSTQFENSILFLPSAQRFYHMNEGIIREHFPDVETSVVNAFVVPPNKRPYGSHTAGSIGFQVPALAARGQGYPTTHMSFHTAMTPTPLDRQPLVIFEDAIPESPNTSYVYEQIKSYDLTPREAQEVDKAFYLHDSGNLSEIDLPTVRDYLVCKYWEKAYAAMPERASGYYCDAKPGQAVVFNNYRPHGDGTLAPSPQERITVDIRCFSKVQYPSKTMTGGIDLIFNPEKKKRQKARKRAVIECLLLLIGYEDMRDFLGPIYGSESDNIDLFDIMTDLQFSVYNKTKYYILEQNLEPHYERVAKLYDRIEREGGFVPSERAKEAIARLN